MKNKLFMIEKIYFWVGLQFIKNRQIRYNKNYNNICKWPEITTTKKPRGIPNPKKKFPNKNKSTNNSKTTLKRVTMTMSLLMTSTAIKSSLKK